MVLAIGLLLAPTLAAPQDGPAAQQSDAAIGEVIVTARRIEESARRLPLALDVSTVTQLGAGAVQDLASLSLAHPGLAFESMWGGRQSAPLLRGLAQPSTAGDNVGVFVDEVYQAGRATIDIDMLDLARVEMMRGPQNALFGRGSFAGAINYVSAAPTPGPSGRIQLDAGSDRWQGARATWSRRIAETRWLARLSAGLRAADGTWRSLEGEDLGGFRRQSAVLTLERERSGPRGDSLALNVRYNRGRFGTPASVSLEAPQFNCGARNPASGYWSYFCGHRRADAPASLTPGLPDSGSRVVQASLRYLHPLGSLQLRWLGSYYDSRSTSIRDFDGSASGFWSGVCTDGINCAGSQPMLVTRFEWPNVVNAATSSASEWAQELRLEGDPGRPLQWMLGLAGAWSRLSDGNWFGADRGSLQANERLTAIVAASPARVGAPSQLNQALVPDSRRQQLLQNLAKARQWTASAFGALQWPLTGSSKLRMELRATRESLHQDSIVSGFHPDTSPDPGSVGFTSWTPRFSVDLSRGEHWYGYVSVARGARTGGINAVPGLSAAERRFEPESNWTTELAVQFTAVSLLRHARLTLYRTDWLNTQITGLATTPGVGTLITTNTAGILARGVELSARVQPHSAPLALDLAASLADTRFRAGSDDVGSRVFCGLATQVPTSDFCAFGPPRSGASGSVTAVPYLDGNRGARAPRTSGIVTLQWIPQPLRADWRLGAQASLAWQGDAYERPINGLRYGARELLSTRVTLGNGRWQIQLWGDNLTDARYLRTAASRGGAFYPSLPRPSDLIYGERRRFGVTLARDLAGL